MKKAIKFFFVLLYSLILVACETVQTGYTLPNQNLIEKPISGETKVVFYNGNGFNPLYLDGSWRVGIKIDGVGVENLHINEYVQVFLKPGTYKLELSHRDLFLFEDVYDFVVTPETMYVEVYNTLIGNNYRVFKETPDGFGEEFSPGSW